MAEIKNGAFGSNGDAKSDWSEIQPLMIDLLSSLKLIAQLRKRTILVQLIELAKAEALRLNS